MHDTISVSVTTADGPQASHAVELLLFNLSRVGDNVDDAKRPKLAKDYHEATRFVEEFARAA
ncbi:MAG: hypothetical protein DRJ50_10400 [Actinobacteria bacterium]|nr:MAG: hypothetical protein DRJ50_10400 [Actinomycetota bacterium]